uniref:HCFC1 n=1 Tax=Mesocestoides corti TaxID=53468 RepID=A0A5K3G5S6_MESCO
AEEASEGESVSPVVPIGGLGFRRHSPRKVIRKVYTGTSTVPKILNRKRLMVSGAAYPTPSQAPSAPPPTPSEDTMLENRSQKMFYQVSTGSTPEPLVTESAVAATAEPQTDQSNVSVSGAALISTVEPPAPSSVVIESSKSAAVATSEVATPVTTSTTS